MARNNYAGQGRLGRFAAAVDWQYQHPHALVGGALVVECAPNKVAYAFGRAPVAAGRSVRVISIVGVYPYTARHV